MQIDCKGYLIRGAHKPAIVVATKQGLSAQGRDEEELVPVGAGALNVGGSPVSPAGNAGQARLNPYDPNQIYRTRVIILLDMSYSMSHGKLKLVQEKIKELSEGLNSLGINDLEFITIPFNHGVLSSYTTNKQSELIKFVQSLRATGGTTMSPAMNTGFSKIKPGEQNEARNIMIIITDGRTEGQLEVLHEAERMLELDCSAYLVGVGIDYDEKLLRNVLTNAKFGGLVHLSATKKDILPVFGSLLPEFMAQTMTAPDYPIVSFSDSFHSVFNITPSVREVIKEDYDRKLLEIFSNQGLNIEGTRHFPSICGYQLVNYSVGFIDEGKLDNGKVLLHVLPRGNSKQVTLVKEIEIEPFEDAILDPGERDIIGKLPGRAELNTILHSQDDKPLQDFLDRNRDKLGPDESRIFDDELSRRTGDLDADPDASRSAWSESDSMTSSDTIAHFGGTRIFDRSFVRPGDNSQVNDYSRVTGSDPDSSRSQVNDFSQLGSGFSSSSGSDDPGLHSGIVHALDASVSIGDLPNINGPEDLNAAAYGKPIPPDHFRLEVISGNISLTKNDFEVKDGSLLIVGQNPGIKNAITIDSPSLNDRHCYFYRQENDISIVSIGGAEVRVNNEEQVSGCRKRLSSGDIITLGDIKMRFMK